VNNSIQHYDVPKISNNPLFVEGGAVPTCYGRCKEGPDPDDGCVQFCKRFDKDAVCKNGMCCCALPPPRM